MPALYSNNVAAITAADVGPSDTAILLASGQGALFPQPVAGQWFWATLIHPVSKAVEIVQCTSRSANSLTVVRGRDNTTAIAFPTGTVVEMRAVAQMWREVEWRSVADQPSGISMLDATGKVPAAKLPATIVYTVADRIPEGVMPAGYQNQTAADVRYGRLAAVNVWAENQTFNKAVAVFGRVSISAAPGSSTAVLDVGDDAQLRDVAKVNTMAIIGTQDNTQAALQFGVTGPSTGGVLTYNTATGNFQILPASGGAFGIYHEGNFNPATKVNSQFGEINTPRFYRDGFSPAHGIAYWGNSSAYILFDSANFTNSHTMYGPNFIATCDVRMKKSIRPHKTPKNIGDKVALVSWEWRRNLMKGAPTGRWTGPLAQEVEKFAPWHVHVGTDGVLGLDKAGLALEVATDDARRIQKLEAEVAELRQYLNLLTKKIR